MRHHPTRAPSSFPAKAVCSCFQSGPAGEAAERGTEQHEALEQAFKGLPITGKFEPDEIESMEWAYKAMISIFEGFAVKREEIQVEFEVTITDAELNELTFGTVDAGAVFRPGEAGVFCDYKSGEIRNYREQMEAYAVGFMQKYGLKECDAFIVYGRRRTIARYHFDFNSAFANTVALCFKIDNPSLPVRCQYCDWCKLAGECSAVVDTVQEVMSFQCEKMPLVAISTATPEQLANMKRAAETVYVWAERVDLEVKTRLLDKKPVPGFKLQHKKGAAFVTDISKAVELLKLPVPAFLRACGASVPKLAKEYAAAFKMAEKKAREKVEEILASVIDNKADSDSVVKDSE